MCKQVTCDNCSKPTWAGCGQHIEEALAGVALKDRCQCAGAPRVKKSGGLFSKLRARA